MKKILILLSLTLALNTFAFSYVEFFNKQQFTQSLDKNDFLTNSEVDKSIDEQIKYAMKNLKDPKLEIKANNPSFKSVLITTSDNKYYGLTFDATTGKRIYMKDFFVNGYESPVEEIIKNRMFQFGLKPSKKFSGISKWFNQNYYLEDFAVVILMENSTDFADKNVVVPILVGELRGLVK